MNPNLTVENDHARAEVAELLDRRSQVQEWLERLQDQRGSVSDHVLERVEADYEQRLRETLEALSVHRDSLQAQLDEATARLVEAEGRHSQVQDALEEGRLRNSIGELDNEAWSTERIDLESTVETAATNEAAVREETEHLRELIAQLTDEDRPYSSEPEGETVRPLESSNVEAAEPLESAEADVFLEEIDRSVSDTIEEPRTVAGAEPTDDVDGEPPGEDGESMATAPKPGLKCPECGYTNDLSAWFCGVCGADIG